MFDSHPAIVAPLLLGGLITTDVTIRITEVEAYAGPEDPGSHARAGQTKRNRSMFGSHGRLYVYRSYGIHWCLNIVCHDGDAGAILIRSGEVVAGHELAEARSGRTGRDLARGPGRLGQVLGIDGSWDGEPPGRWHLELTQPGTYASGPRVGVSGPGGTPSYPWRFWRPGPYVSTYRAGRT